MKKLWLSILIGILSLGVLSSCAAKPKPEEPLTAFLDAFKNKEVIDYASIFNGDVSSMTANPLSSAETPTEISTKMMEMILSYEYVVKESVIAKDGLTAVVTIEFTTIDIGQLFKDFTTEYMTKAFELAFSGATEEEITQVGIEVFLEVSNAAVKDKITTVEVDMVKEDGKWMIKGGSDNLALFDGLMGGLITYMEDMGGE